MAQEKYDPPTRTEASITHRGHLTIFCSTDESLNQISLCPEAAYYVIKMYLLLRSFPY